MKYDDVVEAEPYMINLTQWNWKGKIAFFGGRRPRLQRIGRGLDSHLEQCAP
jgi:hypothetical protein